MLPRYPMLVSSKHVGFEISLFMLSIVFSFKLSQHSGLFSDHSVNPFKLCRSSLEFVIIKK